MRKIIFTRPDGSLSVVHPIINTIGEVAGFTEAQAEQRAFNKLPLDAIDPLFVEATEIPTDRTFRDAWVKSPTGPPVVDMPKARDIHKDALRALRKPLIEALDVEMTKAYKDPAMQDAIEAKRQALRDVTADPAIAAAQTPEQLKSVMPVALAGPRL